MRVIALIAAFNERRFIVPCLDHLRAHGIHAHLIDNESTDGTAELARQFPGDTVSGVETMPRHGRYRWTAILKRKEELAHQLEADWFIHLDPDEFRFAPPWAPTLREALSEVGRRGFNAVNFQEHCFIPTREAPDHDHPTFRETMRNYYAYSPRPQFRLTAWKKQPHQVDLSRSGGHAVAFPGLRPFPENFPMRHYLFLSRKHAVEKYRRVYDPAEVARGWHGWRTKEAREDFPLPSESELLMDDGVTPLDSSNPRKNHLLERIFTG